MTTTKRLLTWRRRSLLLPLAAIGLAVIVPLRALDLAEPWQFTSATSVARAEGSDVTPPVRHVPQPAPAPAVPISDERPSDSRLLAEMARRKAELDRRERELEIRATEIAAAEQLARQQVAELGRMRQMLEALVGRETTAAEADLTLLVGFYTNMKPVQAAAVLGKLDSAKAAAILQRLDTRSAGPILAAMDPSAALAVTEVIQQRRSAFHQ